MELCIKKKLCKGLMVFTIFSLVATGNEIYASSFGNFVNERKVNIIGYSGHAMEPFISPDGQYLFWNSLNDAIDTCIFYAKRINDLNFQFMGKVGNVNGNPPHLDAVASMDLTGKFYWVSTRGYPKMFENYQVGFFDNGFVKNIAPVQGDFYIRRPGWIIMDAEINQAGNLLFYVNARFSGGALPVETSIGVAHKVNGQFVKDPNAGLLFANINLMQGIEYAPVVSADGLEICFTRLLEGRTQIFISKRNALNEPFGKAQSLNIQGDFPEAPSLTLDGKTLYYHKKDGKYYSIFKMSR